MKKITAIFLMASASLMLASCHGGSSSSSDVVDYEMSYAVSDVSFEMTKIPADHFTMGISSDNRRKITGAEAHEVAVDGFVISAAPVSQALWTAVMGSNPSSVQNPQAPVDMVSWNDVEKFISKLGKMTGKTFFLPTEAQWELASRLNPQIFTPAYEWCSDAYDLSPEASADGAYVDASIMMVNPTGPKKGSQKVVRSMVERLGIDCHTKKSGVIFRLAQPTGESLPASTMNLLTGSSFEREAVDASADKYESFTVGDENFRMIKVKGGEFTLGYSDNDAPTDKFKAPENETITSQVTLSDYAIGETEVTVGLWNAVMGSVPYLNDLEDLRKPVVNVSWYNCQTFIQKLNEMTGRKFRLPTEAEWEYAARGGSLSHGYVFSGGYFISDILWNVDNAKMKVQNVKTKKANEIGLYDMCGNAWEWCFDRGADYTPEAKSDPAGPAEGSLRVMRGGSAASKWEACRITNRSFIPPVNVKGTFGLRLAL